MFKNARLYPITAVMLVAGGIIVGAPFAQSAPLPDCTTQWKTMQDAKTVPADMTEAVFLKSCKTTEASAKKKPMIKDKKQEATKPVKPVAAEKPAEAVAATPEVKPDTTAIKAGTPKVKKAKKKMIVAPVEAAKPVDAKTPVQAEADPATPHKAADKTMVEAKPAGKIKKMKKMAAPAGAEKEATMAKPEAPVAAPETKAAAMKKPTKKAMETASKVAEKPKNENAMQQQRIAECGNQWKTMKVANKVPTGLTWSKFWLVCSGKMKAAGK